MFNFIIMWSDQQSIEHCAYSKVARYWWTAPSFSDYTFGLAQTLVKEYNSRLVPDYSFSPL
jgi:hypothetical protein